MDEKLRIDLELQRLIPPLSQPELLALEQSIIAEGCREPIVIWDGTIVDGHNRYAICTKHKIKFNTIDKKFSDKAEAKRWMFSNQFGRRNLSSVQLGYVMGSYYRLIRKPNGGARKGGTDHQETIDIVAEIFSCSSSAVRLNVQLSDAIDNLSETARAFAMNKEVTARKQHIVDLSQLSHKAQNEVVSKVEGQEIPNLANAILRLRPKAVAGQHSVKCRTCGARLAPGVVTCLKCDLDDRKVDELLAKPQYKSTGEVPADYQDRLAAMRMAKTSGDEVSFHADWLIEYLRTNEIIRNSIPHKKLGKLLKQLRETVGLGMVAGTRHQ
jgi:hypothetical protein